jgi:hypothetical protein
MSRLFQFQPRIVDVGGERAVHAAAIKIDRKISYADAFLLDLAMDSADQVLLATNYGFKSVADLARIEFLPAKWGSDLS